MVKNRILYIGGMFWLSLMLSACGGGSTGVESSTSSNNAQMIQADNQLEATTPVVTDEDDTTQAPNPVVDEPATPAEDPQPDMSPPETNPEDTIQPPNPVVDEPINRSPVAIIDAQSEVTAGETVTLDGSRSYDPDQDALSFQWRQIQGQGPDIGLADNANAQLILIAPMVEQPTRVVIQLTVSDGELSASDEVELAISPLQDMAPPQILSRSPRQNETHVLTTAVISVRFDEPLLEASINQQSLRLDHNGNEIFGNISYDDVAYRLSFTATDALSADTTYTVTVSDTLQDLAGNSIEAQSWMFTTGSQYNLGQTSQDTIDLCMDEADMQMLTLVNNARAIARSCGTTQYAAASALSWHCSLEQAAQGHSSAMAYNNFFSHTGLDGSSPGNRISATGYPWRAYGENIAAGYATEEAAMEAWLNSSGHCSNIMNTRFTEMGAASAEESNSQYRIYWTQNFADR